MRIIVVGCGRLGSALAYRLYKQGHDVAVVDEAAAAFNNLPVDFQGRLYEGDAMSQDVLERAGIQHCEAIAAVTNRDSLNMVVGHVAQAFYHVPNVVSRNYNPNSRSLFEDFNLQVVSATSWAAQRLEEMIYHPEIRSVFSAGNGEVEIYELKVQEDKAGKSLQDVLNIPGCMPVSVTRAGRAFFPEAGMVIEEGDVILVSATDDGIETLRRQFNAPKKEA